MCWSMCDGWEWIKLNGYKMSKELCLEVIEELDRSQQQELLKYNTSSALLMFILS